MLFENLTEQIKEYPKLYEVIQTMLREGFIITNITASSMSPVQQLNVTYIEVGMENSNRENILLIYTEGIVKSMRVEKIPSTNEKIHPNILLNKDLIHNKTFRKRLFGGYDIDEVNVFLDLVINDYKFIENVLLKENKILKEDIKKFR